MIIDPANAGAVIAGLVGIALFVVWELRRSEPMLDPRNFLRRELRRRLALDHGAVLRRLRLPVLGAPIFQLVKGYSPLHASAALLPMALVVIPLSRVAPMIAGRVGIRVAGATGLSLMATGFIILSTLGTGSDYWLFLAGLLPFGAGMALAGAPATTAIVASLPREKQGVASAVNDVSRELGGALGIAVIGSLFNSGYRSSLSDHVCASAGDLQTRQPRRWPRPGRGAHLGAPGQVLVQHAESAFLSGLHQALLGAAAVLLVGALFVAVGLPAALESRADAGQAAPVRAGSHSRGGARARLGSAHPASPTPAAAAHAHRLRRWVATPATPEVPVAVAERPS